MPIPSILVGGLQPPPLGAPANGFQALGATGVALSLASTVGIGSILYSVTQPAGSACAIASAAPAAPFSTTIGPFDKRGTYIISAVANGDPKQAASVAVAVKTPFRGLRLPAYAEGYLWDPTIGWWQAMADLFDAAEADGYVGGTATTTSTTPVQIAQLTIPANTVVDLPLTLLGRNQADGLAWRSDYYMTVKKAGAGSTPTASVALTASTGRLLLAEASSMNGLAAAAALTVAFAADTVTFYAAGLAATTIHWQLSQTAQSVS